MRLLALPATVADSDYGRLIKRGHVFAVTKQCQIIQEEAAEKGYFFSEPKTGWYTYTNWEMSSVHAVKAGELPSENNRIGVRGEFDSVGIYSEWVVYSLRKEKRRERRTRIRSLATGMDLCLDKNYGQLLGGAGKVAVMNSTSSDEAALTGLDLETGLPLWAAPRLNLEQCLVIPEHDLLVRECKRDKEPPILFFMKITDGEILRTFELDSRLATANEVHYVDDAVYARTLSNIYIFSLSSEEVRIIPVENSAVFSSYRISEDRIFLAGNSFDDAPATVASYDLASGKKLGEKGFPEYRGCTPVFRLGEFWAVIMLNRKERPGWKYNRVFIFTPEELESDAAPIKADPILVDWDCEEVGNGEHRYRVRIPPLENPVQMLWQLEIGAHSCAYLNGFSKLTDQKDYNPDFGGEILMDCRNLSLSPEQRELLEEAAAAIMEDLRIFSIVDAIRHERIRVVCEF